MFYFKAKNTYNYDISHIIYKYFSGRLKLSPIITERKPYVVEKSKIFHMISPNIDFAPTFSNVAYVTPNNINIGFIY